MSKQQLRLNELLRLANIASAQDAQLSAMINLVSHRSSSPVVTDAGRDMEFNSLLPGVAERLNISQDLLRLLIENGVMLKELAENSTDKESKHIYKLISVYYDAQMQLVRFNNTEESKQRIKNLALMTQYKIGLKVAEFYGLPFCKLYFPTKASDDQYLQDIETGQITPEQNFATRFNTLLSILVVAAMIVFPVASFYYFILGIVQESLAVFFSSLVTLLFITPIFEVICFATMATLATELDQYKSELKTMKSTAETRVDNLFSEFVKQVKVEDFVQAPSEQEIVEAKAGGPNQPDLVYSNGGVGYTGFRKNVHIFFSNYPENSNETKPLGPPPPYTPT